MPDIKLTDFQACSTGNKEYELRLNFTIKGSDIVHGHNFIPGIADVVAAAVSLASES